uniref:Uncharacterized protein n=1 Tax=Octopus bimaculoides TaxID=37653 RepID=A0A0L8G365_OCTBM
MWITSSSTWCYPYFIIELFIFSVVLFKARIFKVFHIDLAITVDNKPIANPFIYGKFYFLPESSDQLVVLCS